MSIKTYIEIPVTLHSEGDPRDGDIYAEIEISPAYGFTPITLGYEDLLLLLGEAGVEALAAELIQDKEDQDNLRGDYMRDLQLDKEAEDYYAAKEINERNGK